MKLLVISPEGDDPREIAVLGLLLAAGLERYHVRKPHWSAAELASWLDGLPYEWRWRLVLHQHHELVARFGLGGRHWRDDENASDSANALVARGLLTPPVDARVPSTTSRIASAASGDAALRRGVFASRSCHDTATLRAALGRYDSVFFGPLFPSLSKPGYGPASDDQVRRFVVGDKPRPAGRIVGEESRSAGISFDDLVDLLAHRAEFERRAAVFALGGVTVESLARVRALGFDGAAVLGAVWQATDPVAAFQAFQAESEALRCATTSP